MQASKWARLGLCLVQAGCASSPSSIDARYVSPATYQSWTCAQLGEEHKRLSAEVQRVSGLQRENANADAAFMTVGLILLWPALFGLAATKDRKEELGRLKGEYEAVDQSMKMRQCVALPPPPSAPVEVSTPVTPSNAGAQ
ncbi:hypothetical protein FHP25_17885 [Vineibacter terrae]|uniref:Metal ABC transporter ATP-binding protein n=1 Tax=Vineibacter terrae TaxID=2586908 RepID=A0A5C8PLH0_9HYPH|nr:hypothetical protein [Vineibacter terrae]TXL74080.1 hypothetical protein FHP25_17885 [Vineibacter terrae]